MSRRIALRLAYDGTDYAGWQRQTNAVSIQQVLEETIENLFHEQVHLIASGRTDAGVHAEGQVAAMDLNHPVPPDRLLAALNSNLPSAIRVMDVWETSNDFQPRYDAKRKTYRYTIYAGEILPPKYRFTAMREYRPVNWDQVASVMKQLEGEHDFAAFHSTGSSEGSTIRTIYEARCEINGQDPHMHEIWLTGNGFLYNMVRIIVGTLLEIGCGKRSAEDIAKAFQTGERRFAGPTAPAQGLSLVSVEYEKNR